MANRYWVGGSGTWNNTSTTNWSATSGGASGVAAPTTGDTVFFDSNSGTAATVTVASTAVAAAATVDKSDINLNFTGNATLSVAASNFTFTSGTLTLNTYTLTVGRFISSNTNARTIAFGTGNITLTGNNATIFSTITATGLVITGTPIVNSTYSGATGTRTIRSASTAGGTASTAVTMNISAGTDIADVGGHYVNLNYTGYKGAAIATAVPRSIYGNLTFDSGMTISGTNTTSFVGTSGTQQITTNGITLDFPITFNGIGGTFAFQGALTQGSTRAFTITNGTVQLKAGVTSTVGSFATSGTNQKFLRSTLANSSATLSQASGTVSASYLTIQDINAVGGATWNALYENGNVDAGGNNGWNFGGSPQTVTEVTYRLRSFTEPRRF
jgi:hypothetical protein